MPRKRSTPDRLPPLSHPIEQVTEEVAAALRALPRWSHWSQEEFDSKVNAAARELVRWRALRAEPIPEWMLVDLESWEIEPPKKGPTVQWQKHELAGNLEIYFAHLTGQRAKYGSHPDTHQGVGKFFNLVRSVFRALEMPGEAERYARQAAEESRNSPSGPPEEIEDWTTARWRLPP